MDVGLLEQGFELWDIIPGYRDPETGCLEQYDGVYFRTPAANYGGACI